VTNVPENNLVSPLAQLEMLRVMQHELNVRVARIHDDINAHQVLVQGVTAQDQEKLRKAADDQAELSNFIRKLADEIRYAKPVEDSHAGLH
jgi:hypothetical protein